MDIKLGTTFQNPHNYFTRYRLIEQILHDRIGVFQDYAIIPSNVTYDDPVGWQNPMPPKEKTTVCIIDNEPVRAYKEKVYGEAGWNLAIFDHIEKTLTSVIVE